MAELHAPGFTAVLTADADFEIGLGLAAAFNANTNQLADAVNIDAFKRIARQNLLVQIIPHKCADIITAETERHLRQVVSAEAEERGLFGNPIRQQRCSRYFNHRTGKRLQFLQIILGQHFLIDPCYNLHLVL